ncbi:hypothetical protein HDU96_001347 [Phlyctochytrium bullatum]|nr:hypothetical protein HDU96_001347 [Phlyctochytrium bullatum]
MDSLEDTAAMQHADAVRRLLLAHNPQLLPLPSSSSSPSTTSPPPTTTTTPPSPAPSAFSDAPTITSTPGSPSTTASSRRPSAFIHHHHHGGGGGHRRTASVSSIASAASTVVVGSGGQRPSQDALTTLQQRSPHRSPLSFPHHHDHPNQSLDDTEEVDEEALLYHELYNEPHPASLKLKAQYHSEFFKPSQQHDTTPFISHDASSPQVTKPQPPRRISNLRIAFIVCIALSLTGLGATMTWMSPSSTTPIPETPDTSTIVPATPSTPRRPVPLSTNTTTIASGPLGPHDPSSYPLVYLSRARVTHVLPLIARDISEEHSLKADAAAAAAATDVPRAQAIAQQIATRKHRFPYGCLPSHLGQDVFASELVTMCGEQGTGKLMDMVKAMIAFPAAAPAPAPPKLQKWRRDNTTTPPPTPTPTPIPTSYPDKLRFFRRKLDTLHRSRAFSASTFTLTSHTANTLAWSILSSLRNGTAPPTTPADLQIRFPDADSPDAVLEAGSSRIACGGLSDARDLVERYCVTRNVAMDAGLVLGDRGGPAKEATTVQDPEPPTTVAMPLFPSDVELPPGLAPSLPRTTPASPVTVTRLRPRGGGVADTTTTPTAAPSDPTPTGHARPTAAQKELPARFGVLTATCDLNEPAWFGGNMFGKGAADYLFAGTHIQSPTSRTTPRCTAWIETPLFFISRWDTTNPYQAHQDLLNTFRVFAALGISADAVQPVLLDTRGRDGPFAAAYASVFGGSRRLMGVKDLAGLVAGVDDGHLCLRTAVWGVHGGISPLARNGGHPEQCEGESALVRGFAAFVLDRVRERVGVRGSTVLGGETETPPGEESKEEGKRTQVPGVREMLPVPQAYRLDEDPRRVPRVIKVTYAIRKSATPANPSEGGSTLDTVFDGLKGLNLTTPSPPQRLHPSLEALLSKRHNGNAKQAPWEAAEDARRRPAQLSRVLANEGVLVAGLRQEVESWRPPLTELDAVDATASAAVEALLETESRRRRRSTVAPPAWRAAFRAVDFATLSFQDQLAVAQDTDVFVGPHGAVFAHLMYLRRVEEAPGAPAFDRDEALATLYPSQADVIRGAAREGVGVVARPPPPTLLDAHRPRPPTPAQPSRPNRQKLASHPLLGSFYPLYNRDSFHRGDPADAGGGGVVELQPPERSVGNHQFRNLAARTGLVYRKSELGSGKVTWVHVDAARGLVRQVLGEVWVRRGWVERGWEAVGW